MASPLTQLLDVDSLFYWEAGKHYAVLHPAEEVPPAFGQGKTIQEAAQAAIVHRTMWRETHAKKAQTA